MQFERCKEARRAVSAGTGFAGVRGQEVALHAMGQRWRCAGRMTAAVDEKDCALNEATQRD